MLGAKGKTETLLLSLVAKLPPSLLIRTARAQLLDSVYHSRKGKRQNQNQNPNQGAKAEDQDQTQDQINEDK